MQALHLALTALRREHRVLIIRGFLLTREGDPPGTGGHLAGWFRFDG